MKNFLLVILFLKYSNFSFFSSFSNSSGSVFCSSYEYIIFLFLLIFCSHSDRPCAIQWLQNVNVTVLFSSPFSIPTTLARCTGFKLHNFFTFSILFTNHLAEANYNTCAMQLFQSRADSHPVICFQLFHLFRPTSHIIRLTYLFHFSYFSSQITALKLTKIPAQCSCFGPERTVTL